MSQRVPAEDTSSRSTSSEPSSPDSVFALDCIAEPDHPLRAICTAELEQPSSATLTVSTASDPSWSLQSSDLVTSHTFRLLLLPAGQAVTLELKAGGVTETFSYDVPEVAEEHLKSHLVSEGDPSVPYVMGRIPCAGAAYGIWSTADGALVSFHDFLGTDAGVLEAFDVVDGEVVAIVEVFDSTGYRNELVVLPLHSSEPSLVLRAGIGFEEPLHHDAVLAGDTITALYQYDEEVDGTLLQLDGLKVFDRHTGAVIRDWRMSDHIELSGRGITPEDADFSHGNSVHVTSAGEVLVGFRHLSSVWSLAPETLELSWTLVGDPAQTLPSDLRITGSGPSFEAQHHARYDTDGTLLLFDNRSQGEPSSVLRLEVDDAAGTAHVLHRYPLPLACDFQGGAWTTAQGHVLATCAPDGRVFEFEPEATTPRWAGQARCDGKTLGSMVPRFLPYVP